MPCSVQAQYMKSILAKLPDGTLTLTIAIPAADVKKAREEAVEHAVTEAELPGFRKGKAPKNLVEEKLDPLRLQEDTLRHLLPKAYSAAVLEHNLKPIVSPKIQITKLEDPSTSSGQGEKDWEFTATTCEMPEVKLGEYKKAVKDVTAKSKIEIAGKEKKEIPFDEIMQAIVSKAEINVPSILVESEVERMLSQMLDDVKALGLSLDQYLASTHKTVEQVREEYATRAKTDVTVEFVLQKIADEEKITVSEQEVNEAILKATNPAEKANLERNKYVLAAILRQQKTFDYLKNL